MNLSAMHPKRHTRAPYRGGRHDLGVHPATRRVDLRMTTIGTQRPASTAHLDGVPWYTAPIPPDRHACWPQSQHTNDSGVLWLERCPCGAARVHHPVAGAWIARDSRATGRTLSPSVIRLAAVEAHRRATQHERQAAMTSTRQVIQCSYADATQFAPCGARAYVIRVNATTGHDRIVVLARTHSGRWVQRWENTARLHNFQVVTLRVGHPHHGDRRLRTFSDAEATRFLSAINAAPRPRADVAAAMTRIHAGGAR